MTDGWSRPVAVAYSTTAGAFHIGEIAGRLVISPLTAKTHLANAIQVPHL
ncbi:hypothetical protein AB0C14_26915 [Microbispora hainanensis]